MNTSTIAQPTSERYALVADPLHTVAVVAALTVSTAFFKVLANRLALAPHPNRLHFYLVGIAWEWILFALVVAGVRRDKVALRIVLGERWHSVGRMISDIGIAVIFWVIAVIALSILRSLLGIFATPDVVHALSPQTASEIALWIGVSVSAGICEETIFRGCLQAQFVVLIKNAPAGIILSAMVFGACHAYQGVRFVILITFFGVMFGSLAHWRRTVRPGMIAHAWHDTLSGIAIGLIRR